MTILAIVIFGAGYFIGIARDENSPDMSHAMDMMTSDLDGKTGDDFDREFISEMIVHHEGAVDMAESAKINAKHQEIKDLADAIIKAQTTEIGMMRQWMSDWYGAQ